MKKVALSLASVLAAATFAQEASAVPAFARQTGMACTACHAQHFPILNGFGRAFKAAGFTMMGAQEKVEGEHLSIPANLNFGLLLKARYQKTDGTNKDKTNDLGDKVSGSSTSSGQWQIPDEYSMFWGGRVADTGMIKIGSMTEFDAAGGGTLGLRVPVVVDMDAVKLSVIPYATDALGPFYGYSESSTGVTRGVRWAEHRKEISAHQYTGMGAGVASGIAFVAHHEMGYINISRFSRNLFYTAGTNGTNMGNTAITLAVTPTIADWAIVAGVQSLSGQSNVYTAGADMSVDAANTVAGVTPVDTAADTYAMTKETATGVDLQAHGAIVGMETGLYFSNASLGDGSKVKATTFGADVTVVPHTLSLGAAYRAGTNGTGKSDNAVTLTAVYDLVQNVALHANYSMYSGDAYSAAGSAKSLFTGMLEAAW
ncbi:MAG: hypothetical protein WCT35_06385 [Sideroxydans sp.]|jgi:hypothetical protein